MRVFFIGLIAVMLAACVSYPDIGMMSPQTALSQLDAYEAKLDKNERDIRQGSNIAAPPGAIIATGQAAAPALNQISLNNIAADRKRIADDRKRIYQANPNLRPAVTKKKSAGVTTSGSCRLPKSEVSDGRRRSIHAEASKGNFSSPFQTTSQVVAELKRSGNFTCDQIRRQFDAIMVSYRAAVRASDKIVSGSPLGMQCNPIAGSASHSAACTAVALYYHAQTVAALCHRLCN